jgi:FkbM family methyltransferase
MDYDPLEWFKAAYRFETLVDIGASNGEYGAHIAKALGIGCAYFFEPRHTCHPHLAELVTRLGEGAVFPVALGDVDGQVKFIETEYGPSSSLLPALSAARQEFPQIEPKNETVVALRRLDATLADSKVKDDLLIKIDVQGVEHRVIQGGLNTFRRAKAVLIEMSFIRLYEGQSLFEEVHEQLVEVGLRFAGIKNQIMSPKTAQPIFAHCIYIRP